jgi:hypothetical protein
MPIPQQIGEFLAGKDFESHPDKVVAMAYFTFKTTEAPINSSDIVESYGRARLPKPKNLSDVISTCIRRGHLVDVDERKNGQKAWHITATGERYIEEILSKASSSN